MFRRLSNNSKIAIVSTGYALNQANLDMIIHGLRTALPQFCFVVPTDLLSDKCKNNETKLTMPSNSAEMRALHVINALKDNKIEAIWCLTGSEGSSEVIDYIKQYDETYGLPRTHKPFIGMSDVTALHIYLGQEGLVTPIHASLLTTLFVPQLKPQFKGLVEAELKMINHILVNGNKDSYLPLSSALQPLNELAKATREVSGTLVGGCIELLDNSIGTEWQLKTANSILILETLDYPWLEKGGIEVINHLKLAGFFDGVKAIIFGGVESFKQSKLINKELAKKEFNDLREGFFTAFKKQIKFFAENINIPVFSNFEFGHELAVLNTAVPFFTQGVIRNEGSAVQFGCILGERNKKELILDAKVLNNNHMFFSKRKIDRAALKKPISLYPLLNCDQSTIVTAPMIGGCLVAVDRALGINDKLIGHGRILFLDFQSETDPHVDLQNKVPMYTHAILVHMKQVGLFNSLQALIFGGFPIISSDEKIQQAFASNLLAEIVGFFKKYQLAVPILLAKQYSPFPKVFQVDNVSLLLDNYSGEFTLVPSEKLSKPFQMAPKLLHEKQRGVSNKFDKNLQHTLMASITLKGVGFHTGIPASVRVCPGQVDSGIVFQRVDIDRVSQELKRELTWELDQRGERTGNFMDSQGRVLSSLIEAKYNNVTQTTLRTEISNADKVSIATIEHFMAALWVAGVDNALIQINGPELPIMDGSCSFIYPALKMAGLVSQDVERNVLVVKKLITFYDATRDATFKVEPADEFLLDVKIEFQNQIIGKQRFFVDRQNSYQVMDARTFVFQHDLYDSKRETARSVLPDGSKRGATVVAGNKVIVNQNKEVKKLHNGQLRTPDEFCRHKALDACGDMYLGGLIMGKIQLIRSGHDVNNKGMRELYKNAENYVVMRWSDALKYIKQRNDRANSNQLRSKL